LLHDGIIKIADFGLAKVVDSATPNRLQTFSGTPLFMSPQIIKQETYNELADIWSLGVTFYFMLFRHYPWNEANPLKLLKKIELKVANLVPEGAILLESTRDLLQRMLVIDERHRITWEEFFAHRAIQLKDDAASPAVSEIEDITTTNFLIMRESQSEQQQEEIQEFGRRQTMHHEISQNSLVRARRARDYLEFERQCGVFFINVAKGLVS
jgi:serine/threonine-protein kinase ULK/ATG1